MPEQVFGSIADGVNGLLGPVAGWLEGLVWNTPPQAPILALVLLGTGLFVTVRLGLIQLRGFRHAWAILGGKYNDPDDEGDLVHFQALTTALSATVGIGNIAGVAIAIRMGGPRGPVLDVGDGPSSAWRSSSPSARWRCGTGECMGTVPSPAVPCTTSRRAWGRTGSGWRCCSPAWPSSARSAPAT